MVHPEGVKGMLVHAFPGMGDTIYQRPFVRALAAQRRVWVETPWPELWHDVEVAGLLRSRSGLRTQEEHAAKQPESVWGAVPVVPGSVRKRFEYGILDYQSGRSILESLELRAGVPYDGSFSLPVPDAWRDDARALLEAHGVTGPYAVLRPATIRQEWPAPGRNPAPGLMQAAADQLTAEGIPFVTVAYLATGKEWHSERPIQGAAATFERGEADVRQLAALMAGSELVVTPCGFPVPMGIAVGAKVLTVFGGAYRPDLVIDRRLVTDRVRWVAPEPFCACANKDHDCPRDIDPALVRGAVEGMLR